MNDNNHETVLSDDEKVLSDDAFNNETILSDDAFNHDTSEREDAYEEVVEQVKNQNKRLVEQNKRLNENIKNRNDFDETGNFYRIYLVLVILLCIAIMGAIFYNEEIKGLFNGILRRLSGVNRGALDRDFRNK